MSTPTDITGLLDLQAWREAVLPLEPEHFDRASQLSRLAVNETHQWRTYINGLGLCGFVQWLGDRTREFPIQQDRCSLLHPQYTSVLDAVCNLVVGRFTLCLVVTESVATTVVTVPRAVVELPEFAAHLYVVLEVQEEQEQVVLRGCLRYDQLMHYQQTSRLTAQPDWTYTVPLDWFDPDSSHLLFYLRFLDPVTLAMPAIAPPTHANESLDLTQLLPQLQGDAELWEVLSWEQGITLLTNPTLVHALYQQRTGQIPVSPVPQPEPLSPLRQAFIPQTLINVWHWSQDRLDATAQALAWSLPQPLTPAFAMRRSPTKVEAALQDMIQHQGVAIPPQARYACTSLEGTPFQVCVVAWDLSPDQTDADWALLLILVAQPGRVLPVGTKLQVSTTMVLATVTLETTDLYLYVLVEGTQSETFTPTILPPHAEPVTLPAFSYLPNDA